MPATLFPVPEQLRGGGPLMVEDLEVTLKCVTFYWAISITAARLARLLRNLSERNIGYTLTVRTLEPTIWPCSAWNHELIVGDRTIGFYVQK